ncbi:hypothetical protein ACU8NH_37585 (plasmid) [Rhizobium leguminosarum]|jgi:transposase|uniref:hypothetical protein n=1 Tax=Rhizobium TaxID=379 RepID=UPI001FE05269|nr:MULTISPECIES: hypothetical protein [Rhizobium]UTS88692.1 hypothetical protein NE851_07855 [Rhizobium anhuiense bv. trifolii]WSG78370.1 hypothetical protein U8P80_36490 [Rhizobium beringeri]WSG92349.1 hypothetical protein U8P73_30335 [Rhizobium beringeri]WSG98114.1 hypothetical protein U8P76_28760 [Rhizobium johnstonii]WSH18565.1 hypothetical protein U8P74_36490 [Rhizobium beringeri]
MFAPAVVVPPEKPEPKKARQALSPRKASPEAAINLQIDGATLRIASGTDDATIVSRYPGVEGSMLVRRVW